MTDEPDPPRKIYGLKPATFEALNQPPSDPNPAPSPPAPDPGIVRVHDERIDVRDLARIATGTGPVLTEGLPNRENEIHETLRLNLERDKASGWYDVPPG